MVGLLDRWIVVSLKSQDHYSSKPLDRAAVELQDTSMIVATVDSRIALLLMCWMVSLLDQQMSGTVNRKFVDAQ